MTEKTANKLIVTLPSDTEIMMTRDFDAPQKLVYEVFTKKEHIEKWWAPSFTTLLSVEMDSRVGGKYRYVFKGPEGPEMSFVGENLEMVPYSKIVYTEIFVTPEFTSPPSTVTTTFTDLGGGRTRIATLSVYDSKETRDAVVTSGMETGAAMSYDQAEALALDLLTKGSGGGRVLVIEREFEAPRALVWKAWTDAEHFMKWWGPKTFTAPHCKMDFRVGGFFHACMRSTEGQDFWSIGFYREIKPIEKIVYADSFADAQGNVVPASHYGMSDDFPMETTVTVLLEELPGKTKMTLIHSGMPAGNMFDDTGAGWNESFEKLAKSL